MFTGRYERQLDPKGRLTLPAVWKVAFEPRCYLTTGEKACIDVLTPNEFEEVAKRMKAKVDRNELDLDEFRLVLQSTYETDVDRQGRINIDRELRDYAGLEPASLVVVAGTFDKLEIWNAETYAHWTAAARARRQGANRARTARAGATDLSSQT